ncbi:UDP-glucosyltransferase 2-like [Homalodisca vitripennis]|uniref:UDP-glucosyltransferase 2-like n=1 Tax=Homalodisca vitripennis TaxID=197043 RepID=UPI001EEB8173|nr:UDP-glucosyltransferase 2-like [Homalodisca vitripennis]XP_046661720.1 UDP-glucosyltransferase 2-like [Homalodisca vitripennis]XP_046661721.1 UDP-glucosyltransferase 2-like [Homalodisca vitripennis]XP_046661722.1 UDP-glucosyltransferase 2-like [Homalodisca vitripennis]XP_046661723.1 UDP-glucosyltransferase 2-like [Homalodisca vitripennis]XP_046661724.1 UDP-glucosyltransferase 2-like [Homalodisca vitripennis]XP_046661725.1 UDP-glucosyltransferase 2-like [Homalodisca vitripennis]
MHLFSILLSALLSIPVCRGARILALLPENCRSHYIVMEPLLLELHNRGHHLTVVTSFPQKEPLENFTEIDFSSQLPAPTNQFNLEIIRRRLSNMYVTASFEIEFSLAMCHEVLGNERVLKLLEEKFDLVILEIFAADCFTYYPYKMKVPFINFISSTVLPWATERTGLPDNPSYIPNYFVSYRPDMTFFQRTFNTVSLYFMKIFYKYESEFSAWRIAEDVFDEKLPPMDEINRQTSLIFVNSHFTLSQSRPFTPNVIEVGGIHIKDVQPLPKDIKDFLDGANEGVILMSFGSLVLFSSLPPQMIRMFLDVFGTLPQRVILKYEDELLDVPPNVMYKKWLPQSDIIAHPNVRLLITHCGIASVTEAVYYSKPMVAIPLFADQYKNAWDVVNREVGILLDFNNLLQRDFSQAVKAVLDNPRYSENMRRLSKQFQDRPMTPLQTAVYWTEYVIRHQGAPHLRPASVNLPFYQYLLLDVIAVLGVSLIFVLGFLYYSIRLILKLKKFVVYRRRSNKNKNE